MCKLLQVKKYVFMSLFKLCGLLYHKMGKDKLTIIIQKDQWPSFKSQYEITHIVAVGSREFCICMIYYVKYR